MGKTGSSRRWLREHQGDGFVQKAKSAGYRSRAAFKLSELDRREHLFQRGMVVIDLGAAPGGWSQYAAQRVGTNGKVIALDIAPMAAIAGVEIIQGDFREDTVLEALLEAVGKSRVSLVMSDMAPNITGIGAVDQPRAMHLAELALDLARRVLAPHGVLIVKVFQGQGVDVFMREMRDSFATVRTRKPAASRARSREVYVTAKDYSV